MERHNNEPCGILCFIYFQLRCPQKLSCKLKTLNLQQTETHHSNYYSTRQYSEPTANENRHHSNYYSTKNTLNLLQMETGSIVNIFQLENTMNLQ